MFVRFAYFILLITVLIVAVPAAAQSTPTPDAASVIEDCAKLLPPDRPQFSGADAPSVRIVQPAEKTIYGSAVTIAIVTNNFDINAEGRHWHLWVDGQLNGMVYQTTAIIDLTPGVHTLCASLGNEQHADIGTPDGVVISVEAAQAGTPTATLVVDRDAAQVQPEGTVTVPQILVLVGGGLLAAVGGWWFGNRLPKQRKK
ncbi:MAG: hypothetical protein R3E39_10105 [Anaerolineae bacterium]